MTRAELENLKTGDKIRINSTPTGSGWVSEMKRFCGRVVTVSLAFYDHGIAIKEPYVYIEEDGNRWCWFYDMIESVDRFDAETDMNFDAIFTAKDI